MIETISAYWDAQSDQPKSEVYRLLNMIHSMAGRMAHSDIKKEWGLKCTASYQDYALTTWTNGIVDITAETHKDYLGNPLSHEYTMMEAVE